MHTEMRVKEASDLAGLEPGTEGILQAYRRVRHQTLNLVGHLSDEDMVPQSMPDASPAKWHLGHTTWFFETFILQHHAPSFSWFDESFCHIFNSYYESVGTRHARPMRGLLTRPSIDQVFAYRESIDRQMADLLNEIEDEALHYLVTVGLHHEMQHQELLQTDILHLFWHNPTFPVIAQNSLGRVLGEKDSVDLSMRQYEGGLASIGQSGSALASEFCYDCESPNHRVYLNRYKLANRPVSNREWLAFMDDGGYENSLLWLSDGWSRCQHESWQSPLYWLKNKNDEWQQFGFHGLQLLDLDAPVCHVSYYEADAYARWAGKRLPSEQEWECAATDAPISGNFLEQGVWRPITGSDKSQGLSFYGDVWEWTQSPYVSYPGFKPSCWISR